jgi:hypothetical protein
MKPQLRDLFGNPIRQPRLQYEAALEKFDRATRAERAQRVRWVERAMPRNVMMGGPFETMLIFKEAKDAYITGHPIASLVLASAFIEHWLAGHLGNRGFEAEAKRGLAACVACGRANALLPAALLDKLDRVRLHRNPFVHLKSMDHKHIPSRRMVRDGLAPHEMLDRDAKEALSLMFTVGLYARAV